MRLNVQGEIKLDETSQDKEKVGFQIDYQNTMDLDEFLDSENKLFTLKEIENLMQSTSHYHKLYALRILTATCSRAENIDHVFDTVLNDKRTQVLECLKVMSQTHQQRQDFVQAFVELWTAILDLIFGNSQSLYNTGNLTALEQLQNHEEQDPAFYLQDFVECKASDINKFNVLVDMFSTKESNLILKHCCKIISIILNS